MLEIVVQQPCTPGVIMQRCGGSDKEDADDGYVDGNASDDGAETTTSDEQEDDGGASANSGDDD